jgi:hypothetical protein
MRASSSAPSGIGGTVLPASDTFHPCGRCHTGGTRIAFSQRTRASASVKFVGQTKLPLPQSPLRGITVERGSATGRK